MQRKYFKTPFNLPNSTITTKKQEKSISFGINLLIVKIVITECTLYKH